MEENSGVNKSELSITTIKNIPNECWETKEITKKVQPFKYQVSGHGALLQFDDKVAKPLIEREYNFYVHLKQKELDSFTANFYGTCDLDLTDEKIEEFVEFINQNKTENNILSTPEKKDEFQFKSKKQKIEKKNSELNPWAAKTGEKVYVKKKQIGKKPYIILKNITSSFSKPNICDIKIGIRQHGDDAAPDKKIRHMRKCSTTTSKDLGVRLCGIQTWMPKTTSFYYFTKYEGRKLNKYNFPDYMENFFTMESTFQKELVENFLKKMVDLEKSIERSSLRLYSSSLLFVYEGNMDHFDPNHIELKMVDFAHTYPFLQGEENDDGYLFGLRTLQAIFTMILKKHESKIDSKQQN